MFSSRSKKDSVEYSSGESALSVLILKDTGENLEKPIKRRFEYLNIDIDIAAAANKRLYQVVLKTNEKFTVIRSKKIIESMLPDSSVVIEHIGGIPYDENEAFDYGEEFLQGT